MEEIRQELSDIETAYHTALQSFQEKVKTDSHVLAAIVGGSLSYDQVWEKSDIDVWLISDDEKRPQAEFYLVEHGICFSTSVISRMQFKKEFEQSSTGDFVHSFLSKGTVLFCKDESIRKYFDDIHHIGERDREMDLLLQSSAAIVTLEKAQKWFFVKQDVAYSAAYILRSAEALARIEVLLHREIPTREVFQQAFRHNPDLFQNLYTNLFLQPINQETIRHCLELVNNYLTDRKDLLFAPIFQCLSTESGVRPLSEIVRDMTQRRPLEGAGALAHSLEWLSQQGYVQRASSSVRLTSKSRIEMEELAYFL